MLAFHAAAHPVIAGAVGTNLADAFLPTYAQRGPTCASCSLKGVCLAGSLSATELERFSTLATVKRRIGPGQSLFRAGDLLQALYVIHGGSFKAATVSGDGDEKVTGFYFPGEILGLDAIGAGKHFGDATALEGSEVCVIPFEYLQRMTHTVPALQQRLFRALSADISRDDGLMLLLGGMSARQRLAAFLLSLSHHYARNGYSPDCFVLRMTREEIGSYLGLSLETVSRVVSRLHREGLIAVRQREVRLVDVERLTEIAAG